MISYSHGKVNGFFPEVSGLPIQGFLCRAAARTAQWPAGKGPAKEGSREGTPGPAGSGAPPSSPRCAGPAPG